MKKVLRDTNTARWL